MSTNNIDEIFRRGTGNQTPDVPDYMWDKIDNELHHRRRGIWFAVAASVTLLLSVGVALVTLDTPQQQVTEKQSADTAETAPMLHKADMLDAPNYADSTTYVNE